MLDMDELTPNRIRLEQTSASLENDCDSHTDEDLLWDNSPEQFAIFNHQVYDTSFKPSPTEKPPKTPTDVDSSLTDLPPDSDEVFSNPTIKSRSMRLRRSHAFRRRRPRSSQNSKSPNHDGEYNTSDEDCSPTILPPRTRSHLQPKNPEDVSLGPVVQNLQEPLQAIQDTLPISPNQRHARSTRTTLDYRYLHNHGVRRARL